MKPRIPHDCWVWHATGPGCLSCATKGMLNSSTLSWWIPPHALNRRRECWEATARVHQSIGNARSRKPLGRTMGKKSSFVSQIKKRLSVLERDQTQKSRALGWLRKQLGLRAQSVVTGELAKDLVKFEVLEIEKYLSE